MKVVVPHILISGGSVVLASRNSFTAERILHRVCQSTCDTKEVITQVIRDIQHVLIVTTRYHQAVAFYAAIVVSRNQSEHVGIDQDHGRFWSRRWKRLSNTAERTFVSGWGMLHKASL